MRVDEHPQVNSTNPQYPIVNPPSKWVGGTQQQQPHVANPTQLQQTPHKPLTPLTPQQMRLQRRNSTLFRRNTSV
jgi:hypothetical protein